MQTLLFYFLIVGLSVVHCDHTSSTSKATYQIPDPAKVPSVIFVETFGPGWQDRWIVSTEEKYKGKWEVREGDKPFTISGDQGLVATTDAAYHGIAARFSKILDNKDKDLIIQYEVRLQKPLDCGGSYLKLLTTETLPNNLAKFSNDTPYTIMFGPDKCGTTNKVHFIFNHWNPITKKYEEKHLKNPPTFPQDRKTHLYTLEVLKNNTFNIYIDGVNVRNGSLLVDFEPPVMPPKEIDDPDDKKPADWVDEETIPDPDAKKPDDWDENEPPEIPDPDDKKPEDWLDNEPEEIPDPEAKKPEDWNDAEDGEWEAPKIPNPKCQKVGCGKWEPRKIRNPKYKGKWTPPRIPNPAYKGPWKPRKIPNPNYFEDYHPHNFKRMGAIGFEIWTVTSGQMIDNIIITYDKRIADEFAENTWKIKHNEENRIEEEEKTRYQEPGIYQSVELFIKTLSGWLKENPIALGGTVVLGLLPIICCFVLPKRRPKKPTVSEDTKRENEKKDEKSEETKEQKEKEEKKEEKTEEKEETKAQTKSESPAEKRKESEPPSIEEKEKKNTPPTRRTKKDTM
jgi:calnexin